MLGGEEEGMADGEEELVGGAWGWGQAGWAAGEGRGGGGGRRWMRGLVLCFRFVRLSFWGLFACGRDALAARTTWRGAMRGGHYRACVRCGEAGGGTGGG